MGTLALLLLLLFTWSTQVRLLDIPHPSLPGPDIPSFPQAVHPRTQRRQPTRATIIYPNLGPPILIGALSFIHKVNQLPIFALALPSFSQHNKTHCLLTSPSSFTTLAQFLPFVPPPNRKDGRLYYHLVHCQSPEIHGP